MSNWELSYEYSSIPTTEDNLATKISLLPLQYRVVKVSPGAAV